MRAGHANSTINGLNLAITHIPHPEKLLEPDVNAISPTARNSIRDYRTPLDLWDFAVWAIRDQKADRDHCALHDVELEAYGHAMGWEPGANSTDGISRIARIGSVGCSIDGGAAIRGVTPRMHPDAEALMSCIDMLGRKRGLVLEFARRGEQPEWSTGRQQLVRVMVAENSRSPVRHKVDRVWETVPTRTEIARRMMARGEPIVDRNGRKVIPKMEEGFAFRMLGDGSRQCLVASCPVEPWPSTSMIESTNAIYSRWHAGMTDLLARVSKLSLKDHRVTGFRAEEQPWR